MRLEPRDQAPLSLSFGAPLLAILGPGALCPPRSGRRAGPGSYGLMLRVRSAAACSHRNPGAGGPLILTGLAAALAFRAKLWNIGGEGQLYLGAVAAVVVGSTAWAASPYVMIPAVMLAGFAAGALLLLIPTLLKTRLGVDEVVTTLLLNFVVLLFVSLLVEGPLQDPMSMGWPQSEPIVEEATLPRLIARTRVHLGLVIALVAAALAWLLVARTRWGFEIRAVGANPSAARFAGISTQAVLLRVAILSGGLAGLAGVGEVAGVRGYLTTDLSPGYGYSGIVVAMLAQLNPLGVVAAALFVAVIFVGADPWDARSEFPATSPDLIVATSSSPCCWRPLAALPGALEVMG